MVKRRPFVYVDERVLSTTVWFVAYLPAGGLVPPVGWPAGGLERPPLAGGGQHTGRPVSYKSYSTQLVQQEKIVRGQVELSVQNTAGFEKDQIVIGKWTGLDSI